MKKIILLNSLLAILQTSYSFSSCKTWLNAGQNPFQILTLKETAGSDILETFKPNILTIVPENGNSYFKTKPDMGSVPWTEVMSHISERLTWDNSSLKMTVVTPDQLKTRTIPSADIVLLIGLSDPKLKESILSYTNNAKAVGVFDCIPEYSDLIRYGEYTPGMPYDNILSKIDKFFKSPRAKERLTYEISQEMWTRKSSGDLLFLSQVMIDCFSTPVPSVKSVSSTESTSLSQVHTIFTCSGNDQVCAYRCITSYESPAFQQFALCILQKHNCMGNSATMPTVPDPAPMTVFRGTVLSHEVAEQIFEGHLDFKSTGEQVTVPLLNDDSGRMSWSWKVVCGQNPAYDYFSCQHQIFYKDVGRGGSMWYDPVFKVETLSGEDVWRRRHYREFWRILDCAEDLSWAVFYYTGAASAAGTSYTGALVVSPDGSCEPL
eukprot:gene3646-7273_t